MGDKPRILLVDDEPIFLSSMTKVLSARGYEVGSVGSGPEALEVLQSERYDVVVLDQRMPGMDGLTTLEHIRKRDALLPVILLSGHAEVGTAVEAMSRGAVDYLLKPAHVQKLCERIQAALEKRSILEELEEGGPTETP